MSAKYDCVVTNPPYLNPSACEDEMRDYAQTFYPDSKTDTCVMFIERCLELGKRIGLQAMITMHSWMYIGSYERFRKKFITAATVISMAHVGKHAFEDIPGEKVQTTSWIMRRRR